MRIGIDACCWANRRGYGRFTREILTCLFYLDQTNEYLLFADELAASLIDLRFSNIRVIAVPTREAVTRAAAAQGSRNIQDLARMTHAVFREKLDWFFFPSIYSYFPILNRCRIAMTIHDTIAESYPHLIFPNRRAKFFWDIKVWMGKKQADVFFTVSEFAKNSLVKVLHIDRSKCHVLHEAPSKDFLVELGPQEVKSILQKQGIGPGTPFLTYLGGINPHKNLPLLTRVFLTQCPPDTKLLLIGDYEKDGFHTGYEAVKDTLNRYDSSGRVSFTGFLPDGEVAALLRSSRGLVLPSLCEGFGLPAVEAMLIGTPVIATNESAIPEIAPDGALFFSPEDEFQLALHLQRLLGNEDFGKTLGLKGQHYVQQLNWNRPAQALLDVLNGACQA